MKKIIRLIEGNLGEPLILLGAGIVGYNTLRFSSYPNCDTGSGIIDFGFRGAQCEFEYLVYYYPESTLLLISVGVMLLVLGILIYKRKN